MEIIKQYFPPIHPERLKGNHYEKYLGKRITSAAIIVRLRMNFALKSSAASSGGFSKEYRMQVSHCFCAFFSLLCLREQLGVRFLRKYLDGRYCHQRVENHWSFLYNASGSAAFCSSKILLFKTCTIHNNSN